MHRFVVFFTLVGLLGACGGGNSSAASTAPTVRGTRSTPVSINDARPAAPSSSAGSLTAAQLAAALPTLADLGLGGWSVGESSDDSNGTLCDVDDSGSQDFADVTFQQSAFGPFLKASFSAPGEGETGPRLDALRTAFKGCRTWVSTEDDGSHVTYHVSDLAAAKVGADSYAIRATADDVPFFGSIQIDVVFWYRGSVGAVASYIAAGPAIAGPNPLADFVQLVDAKLQTVAQ